MDLQRFSRVIAAVCVLGAAAACGGGGVSPGITPAAPPLAGIASAGDAAHVPAASLSALYTINENDTISAFSVDSAKGRLTPIAGSPFASGTHGAAVFAIAYDPAGPTLFTTGANTAGGGNVAVYSVGGGGALSMLSNTAAAGGAHAPVLSPDGTRLYVLSANSEIFGFKVVNHRKLKPIAGSPFTVTCPGLFCASNPIAGTIRGKTLYMVDTYGWVVSTFTIAGSGALTEAASYPTDASPIDLALTPDGKNLFVTDQHDSVVSSYGVSGTSLIQVSGSPFHGDGGPAGAAMTPDGKFLFTADQVDSTVSAFSIAGGKLERVKGSPFNDAGGSPVALAVDSTGKHLYVANPSTSAIAVYAIAKKSGKLAAVKGSPFSLGSGAGAPVGIVLTF